MKRLASALMLGLLAGRQTAAPMLDEPRRVTTMSGVLVGETVGDLSVFKGVS